MKENRGKEFFKRHRKKVCVVVVVILFLLTFLLVISRFTKKRGEMESKMPSVRQQMTQIQKMDLSTSISLTGTIASADSRSVSAGVAGVEITEVNVAVGDYVSAGDTIITLDASSLEEELSVAEDDYDLAVTKSNKSLQDAANQASDAVENYKEGLSDQASAVADALSQYNEAGSEESSKKEAYEKSVSATEKAQKAYEKIKTEKSSLKKAMNKAQKAYETAQKELEAAEAAYEKEQLVGKDENGNIDETIYQTYQNAKQKAQKAEAAYQKAKTKYEKVEQAKTAYQDAKKAEEDAWKAYQDAADVTSGKYKEYEKALDTQSDTNEKNAEQIKESEYNYSITTKETKNNLKNQKNQVQKVEEKLGECVVTSPISGVITSIAVEEGDTYENGEIFVVQDMTSFIVEATVDEYDISDIAKEMEAVVKTDATGDEELAGIVTFVAPTPESSGQSGMGGSSSSSASYKIQISLTDANERLRVGMTAKTSVILSSAKEVLAVPYDYIQTAEDGSSYIEVMEDFNKQKDKDSSENMKTKKITVTKGMESDYYVEIRSDEIAEGMMTVMPVAVQSSSSEQESGFDSIMPGNMGEEMPFGGGMPSGGDMPFGGRMPSGGGANRGGGPGGF